MGAARVEPTGPSGPMKKGLCVSVLSVPSPGPPHPPRVSDLGLRGKRESLFLASPSGFQFPKARSAVAAHVLQGCSPCC